MNIIKNILQKIKKQKQIPEDIIYETNKPLELDITIKTVKIKKFNIK